ncbi:MAG: prepilin-type N-terminal cleavage/methylation domain-containing protein [Myxococcales bacterium]|nr:prepilin-type N-terminal cleavage/methylation domain-containing protein [Myxococcales bacterium]
MSRQKQPAKYALTLGFSQGFRPTRRAEAGMTLLEIMISVFLIGMLGVATMGVITRTQNAREVIGQINDRYHGARVVLDRMSREIAMTYVSIPGSAVNDLSRIPLTLVRGTAESPINRLLFSTFSHVRMVRNARESDQAIVEYYGKPNPKDPKVNLLLRRVKPVINHEPERGGVAYVMLERVKRLEIRYWDKRKNDWIDNWDTTKVEFGGRIGNNVGRVFIPPLIEIKLTVADKKGDETTFLTRTRIMMQGALQRQ